MNYFFKKIILFFALAIMLLAGSFGIWILSIDIPDLNAFEERKEIQSTKIYDRTGEILLYEIHRDIKRTIVPFEDISRNIKNAIIAIEDDQFYKHKGIDVPGIIKAIFGEIGIGKKRGGSTITQQLIKNSILTPERTIVRKIKEMVLAIKLERKYSKEEILNFYLNEVPFGAISYGVENSSQIFFNKSASELTLAESAYLASLPKSPTYYSPYGNHRDELEERKNLVLKQMANLGFISEEDRMSAEKEKVVFVKRGDETLKAPHFVMMVREYLNDKYGEDTVLAGGLNVITTLDWDLQQRGEEVLKQYAEENEEKYNAHNAGMIGVNPKTGEVLVMIGSRDYFDIENDGNFNVTIANRQPGSAFKPFAYATAFKAGYTPDTALFDLQTEFNPDCNPNLEEQEKQLIEILKENPEYEDKCYHPGNYDNVFRGPMSMRDALAQSVNVPAVKTLYLSGLMDTIRTARQMGITTLNDPERYGLTLVLGGGEVKLLEMTGAYGVFANDGVRAEPSFILNVKSSGGKILEENKLKEERVLDEEVAHLINDVLSDDDARSPAFGENSYLHIPNRDVAVKTGTTNDYRDAWIIGYSPDFSLGVWAGNNDNTSMEKRVAGFIVAPMWNAFMKDVLKGLPDSRFKDPKKQIAVKPVLRGEWMGGETYLIDSVSKKLATDFTPQELIEEKVITQIHSILYWIDKNNFFGASPKEMSEDPQFKSWEFSVRKWVESSKIKEETIDNIPKEFDDIHKPEYRPRISVISPSGPVSKSGNIHIKAIVSAKYKISQVDFFIGTNYIGLKKESPYEIYYNLNNLQNISSNENLIIKAYDEMGNREIIKQNINFID